MHTTELLAAMQKVEPWCLYPAAAFSPLQAVASAAVFPLLTPSGPLRPVPAKLILVAAWRAHCPGRPGMWMQEPHTAPLCSLPPRGRQLLSAHTAAAVPARCFVKRL